MTAELRKSGIGVVGDKPWGTHFCHFYETRDDLLDTLVPYFKAGLEGEELCVWVVSEPLTEREAEDALRQALPDLDWHLAEHHLEIVGAREWYLDGGTFEIDRVTRAWAQKLDRALADGRAGLRVSGNTAWLEGKDWNAFCDYERTVNESFIDRRMTVLCTYPLAKTGAAEILDVARNHQFTLARRGRMWDVVETPVLKQDERTIPDANEELERRVLERTEQLSAANRELKREVIERRRSEAELRQLRKQLELENAYLNEQAKEGFAFGEILGESPALRRVLEQIRMVAPTDATVLISGESGTGKELAARAIHEGSPRRRHPMVTVNCASVPRELFESEFFGHVKGAFTGAVRDRVGWFQLAHEGTIFLDEVGEIPLEQQSKLLRALQEGQIERVGEHRMRQFDVRVIAASNHDLQREVHAGRFRRDLYYRLFVFPIVLPPLRDRGGDIALLAEHFLALAIRRLKCPNVRMTDDAIALLSAYSWPGNIRELHHVIERAVILSQQGPLRIDLVLGDGLAGSSNPGDVRDRRQMARRGAPSNEARDRRQTSQRAILSQEDLRRQQRENLRAALEKTGGRIYGPGGAAEMLNVKPTTLVSRVKKLRLEPPR